MGNFKVLHVLEGLDIGGKEICAMNFYRNVDRKKVQFDFAIHSSSVGYFENEINKLGGTVIHYAQGKKINNKFMQFLYHMKCFNKFIKKNHYDIVHIHGCSFFAILTASIPCKVNGVKNIIAHAHNPGMPTGSKFNKMIREIFKWLIKWSCTQYFTCSDVAADSKYTKDILEKKLTYIHNAINLEKFQFCQKDRIVIRQEYKVSNNEILLGIVGRLEKQKNHDYLLSIFNELYKKNSNYKLIVIGTGSLESELKDKVKTLNLQSAVIFTGNISEPEKYYSAIDIFVLPSFYEGFPFVMIEAQANGLPCITSDRITSEVCILDSTYQLPIGDENINRWVEHIEYMHLNLDRNRFIKILKSKGFDIKDESKRLEDLYIKMKGDV